MGLQASPKGVMLSYRSMRSNLEWAISDLKPHIKAGSNILCMLPMAHMYGMAFEFLYEFLSGVHI